MSINKKRIALYIFVVPLLYVYFNFSNISIGLIKLPPRIAEYISMPVKVVFIYGSPCTTCSSGKFLESLMEQADKEKIIFVLSSGYSQNDTSNLIRAFSLKGTFIHSDKVIEKVKEKILKKINSEKNSTGFCLMVNGKKKIEKFYLF